MDGAKATKTYELPLQASWEIDLFGNLRNAKKGSQATLLQQKAYQQAVRSELIAGIATAYYSLLMLDEQVDISQRNLDIWQEQVRTLEAQMKVGGSTENAVTQARANFYELQATHNDLQRQQREAENALCTLLGMTSQPVSRGTLAGQEVNDALYATESSRRSLESHEHQQKQAERTVQTSESLYNTNNATYLELLTARQSLLNAELNVAADRFACLQSVITLYNALGGRAE